MSKKPVLPQDFLYRIDGPTAMAKIRSEGFKVYTNTSLWLESGIPKESFDAQKDGWEIPLPTRMGHLRAGFFTDIDSARKAPLFRDRTLCRHSRTHPVLGDDSSVFVDGCMQDGTALYVVFPTTNVGTVVVDQSFIEFFDRENSKWCPLAQWRP